MGLNLVLCATFLYFSWVLNAWLGFLQALKTSSIKMWTVRAYYDNLFRIVRPSLHRLSSLFLHPFLLLSNLWQELTHGCYIGQTFSVGLFCQVIHSIYFTCRIWFFSGWPRRKFHMKKNWRHSKKKLKKWKQRTKTNMIYGSRWKHIYLKQWNITMVYFSLLSFKTSDLEDGFHMG